MGLGQDGFKVLHRQGLQFNANGKAPLQLRNQIAGLAQVERARSHKQYVVCLDHPVFGGHGRPLDQRQQIPLYALPRDLSPTAFAARSDFVDFVDKHNAVLLQQMQGLALDIVFIDKFGGFLVC